MKRSKFFRKLSLAAILAVALALALAGIALAQMGPVYPPPGGVTLEESGICNDPGGRQIGECQGRTGGLNLTYTGFNFSQFQDLYWGATFPSDVRLKFGGNDWFGYMSYQAANSNLPGGVAVWGGNTDIPLWNGGGYSYTYVDTRFTLVVTDLGGNPLPLEEPGSVGDLITNGPLLHVTGDFKANILFEFYYGGAWVKALEGYDSLHTPPTPGLAFSSYNPGFYYTDVPLEGLIATNDSPTPFGSSTVLTATVLTGTNPAYTWAFGDGATGSGAVTNHIYPDTGLFTALVTATNEANVITATTIVTITESSIIGLSASNDSPTHLGDVTTLQASVTGGSNITYIWALGDGTFNVGQVVTHTYPNAGYYTALVTATNVLNQLTATTTVTIPFEVFLTLPAANDPSVAPGTLLTVTFTGDVAPGTVSTATLATLGASVGRYSGSFSFPSPDQAVFSPAVGFLPGELVTVQVLTGVQSTAGQPLDAPYQWQFYAAALTGSGYFINSGQNLGAASSLGGALGDLDGDGDLDALLANYVQDNAVWFNDGAGFFTDSGQDLGSANNVDVALGDLDGDGDLDAFFAKLGSPDEVWFNNGGGVFTNSGQALGNTNSVDVILGDLDGDGDLDAYVATYNGASDQIWFNDGSGVFTNSGQNLGDFPGMAAALGDVDRDGDLDAYVLYLNLPNKVWLNDGQGVFSDSGQSLGSLPAQDVSLGDLDGDGDMDAFIAVYDQPSQVWLNDGQGLFSDSGQALGDYISMGLDLGDVDADGDLDAFIANLNQPEMVWLNDGSGVFASNGQSLGSSASREALLGDLDGDGDLDAFVAVNAQPSQVWFNQVGVESVAPPPASHNIALTTDLTVTLSGPISATRVTSTTFRVDGAFQGPFDAAITITVAEQRPTILFNPAGLLLPGERVQAMVSSQVLDGGGSPIHPEVWEFRAAVAGGSGNFIDSGQSLVSPSGWTVELGDLDDDGDLDALLVNYTSPSQVWMNNGSGFFTSGQFLGTTAASDVVLSDLDGDGDLDAFIVQMNQPIQVWFNDGSGVFTISGQALGTYESYAVKLGDLDGDGDLDAFVATYNAQPDLVFFNDGAGLFTDSSQTLGADYAVGMTLGDVDNDGDLDAYVANCHATIDKLWLNNGLGQFSDSGQPLDGMCSYDADFGDADGDGDPDVVVANGAAGGQPNQLYLNDGHGNFTNSGQNLGSYQNTAIELGDLDADGDLDLFFTTGDAGQHVWLNNGQGIFTDTGQVLGSAMARGLALGDLDGDGDLDAFVANDAQPSEIWFNENSADLALTKSASPALPQPGDWITYTLTFANLGPQTATNVQIVDQIPVSVTLSSLAVSSSLPITPTGGFNFTWLLPELPPGAGGVITITGQLSATLPGGYTFTNTASLSATELDANPADNLAQASLTTNLAPLAAAGPDQDVDTNALVTLDGRASLDPDGNLPLAYHWTLTSGPPVSFNPALSLTTFTAPDDPAVLAFTLVVTDSLGQPSQLDLLSVTVHNRPPLVLAGPDQLVATLAIVTLDGRLSSDPDGDLPLEYGWAQTGGPVVSFNPALSLTAFTAPGDPAVLTFTLIVTDNLGLPALLASEVVVTVANQPPVAQAGPDQTASAGQLVTLDGRSSSDPDADLPLAYHWTQTGGSAVSFNPALSVTTFTAPGSLGVLTFTLQVTDSLGLPALQPDELVIVVDNRPPLAVPDTYTLSEDIPLSMPAPGVLENDIDLDGDPLSAALLTAPVQGVLNLEFSGAFTYTPALNANGILTFTYTVSDGRVIDQATVTLVITAVNDAPVAAGDAYATDEDTALLVVAPGVLGNDTDVDGDALNAALESGPAHGSLTLNVDGSFLYTPTPNYHGPDSFAYTASDGSLSHSATVDLTVNPVNDAPAAADDAYATDEDIALIVAAPGVLGNDEDVDGEALSAVLDTGPSHGTLTLNSDGSFTYTPTPNYYGPDSFTYAASDGGLGDTAAVSLTVNLVNDAPVAAGDAYATDEDTPLVVVAPGVLGNDTDVDGDALSAALESVPAHGSLTLNADGSFIYAPATDYHGPDSFTYIASDGSMVDTATVNLTVSPVNDAPLVDAGVDLAMPESAVVVFSGAYTDPDEQIAVEIAWDFGDGEVAAGTLTPTHAYADNGLYTVTLVVTDGLGGMGMDTLLASVTNVDPDLAALPDVNLVAGVPLAVQSGFSDPGLLDTHTILIAWDDGLTTTLNLAAGELIYQAEHTYTAAGEYTVSVMVTDKDGGQDATTFVVVVRQAMFYIHLPVIFK